MFVTLFNPTTRQSKQVKVGFSWTVFFFGSFPALFRGDFKWFLIMIIADFFTASLAQVASRIMCKWKKPFCRLS